MNDAIYEIKLRSVGEHPNTPARRLAQLLKLALRGFGLRAISVREVAPATQPDATAEAEKDLTNVQ
jgi:hypothetical protein